MVDHPDRRAFLRPHDEDDVIQAIQDARARGAQLRVRGSGHSVPLRGVYTDGFGRERKPGEPLGLNLLLDRLQSYDRQDDLVTVGAGWSIGGDPHLPGSPRGADHRSQAEVEASGLCRRLHDEGRALPILGGITHQTVGGFLGTGSAGASVKHNLDEQIEQIELIDGIGTKRVLDRSDANFGAALTHLGLLGVVTKVTFRTVKRFGIEGDVSNESVKDSKVDLFGEDTRTGRQTLREFLEDPAFPYSRILWWPQKGSERIQIWRAKRVPYPDDGSFQRNPFVEFDDPRAAQRAVHILYDEIYDYIDDDERIGLLTNPIRSLLVCATLLAGMGMETFNDRHIPGGRRRRIALLLGVVRDTIEKTLSGCGLSGLEALEVIAPRIINGFVPLAESSGGGTASAPVWKTTPFRDTWYQGLPHDNQIDNHELPLLFTELWFPMSRWKEVMHAMRDYFADGGVRATGTFAVELYATGPSAAWMSAAHDPAAPGGGENFFRVDPFVFDDDARRRELQYQKRYWWNRDPEKKPPRRRPEEDHFARLWELLRPYGFRFHWGKYLSRPDSETGVAYRRAQLTRFEDFLALRKQWDPDGIFLNDFWRDHLGIPR
ncbi:MAG: FAD-binding protein [Myxococcota bacterium]